MIELNDCRIDGSKKIKIDDFPTSANVDKTKKAEYLAKTQKNLARIEVLQDKLYADDREGVIILLQAMDAAGKDSTIKHVMSGVNPQGVSVTSFKQPSSEELAHDYLWRASRALPKRGMMAIFNRSYYEDVLVVRVHDLQKTYKMPKRCVDRKDFFPRRYREISNFEEYLHDNGYRIIKIFLNVGLDEQKERFIARIDDETKNWKFSAGDLDERDLWPKYMAAYEDAINGTASDHSPWYVVPADQKWYARYLVSQAIVDVLEDCKPAYPEMPEEDRKNLAACKIRLTGTEGDAEGTAPAKKDKKKKDAKGKDKAKVKGKKAKKQHAPEEKSEQPADKPADAQPVQPPVEPADAQPAAADSE